MGHPYGAPPLVDALTTLHSIVADLAQEVAELRVPCPCKPASTSAIAGDAGAAPAMSAADLADFRAWQAAKAAAGNFAG